MRRGHQGLNYFHDCHREGCIIIGLCLCNQMVPNRRHKECAINMKQSDLPRWRSGNDWHLLGMYFPVYIERVFNQYFVWFFVFLIFILSRKKSQHTSVTYPLPIRYQIYSKQKLSTSKLIYWFPDNIQFSFSILKIIQIFCIDLIWKYSRYLAMASKSNSYLSPCWCCSPKHTLNYAEV